MVNNKQFIPLTLIAVVAGLLTVLLTHQQSTMEQQADLLFPELAAQQTVKEISIETVDERPLVKATVENGQWVVSNKHQFPADKTKLKDFIRTFAEARQLEAKTRLAKNYSKLRLRDIDDEDAQSVLVRFSGAEQSWSVLLGKQTKSGNRYTRFPGQSATWLTDLNVNLPVAASDWLEQRIVHIDEQQVQSVIVNNQINKVIFEAFKDDIKQANFILKDMPEQQQLKYDVVLNPLARSFSQLSIDDVKVADEQWWESLLPSHQVTIKTFSGVEINMTFKVAGTEQFWVKLSSKKARQSAFWAQWYFKLNDYTARQFLKLPGDFLAKKPLATHENYINTLSLKLPFAYKKQQYFNIVDCLNLV